MNETDKEKALNQIDNINSSFLDNTKFVPMSPNSMIIWGIISAILVISSGSIMAKYGWWYGVGFIAIFIAIGNIFEWIMNKKENEKHKLKKFTKTQKFINYIFAINISFAMVLVYIFINLNMFLYISGIFVVLLNISIFIVGFVANLRSFSIVGVIGVIVGLALLIFCSTNSASDYTLLIKLISIIFGSGNFILLGILEKRKNNF